jgi:hypothetical protein
MESINDLAGQLVGGAPPHACLEKFVAESSCQFTPTCWAKSWAQILELSHQLVDFLRISVIVTSQIAAS